MIKLRFILLFLFLFSNKFIVAQHISDIYHVRTKKQNLSLSIQSSTTSQVIIDEYGDILSMYQRKTGGKYFFQGQEYDKELNIYLFPSRLYTSQQKKFFQPDPKSQYHSPYLFVNADPVNKVDFNGKEGKPLVLYEEAQQGNEAFGESISDMLDALPDAYHVPLADFVNREVGDVHEWNGNVFITGHSSAYVGHELEIERANNLMNLRTEAEEANVIMDGVSSKVSSTIGGRDLGKMLREFSHERGVDVKSVVAGGCEGRYAAEEIGKGYTAIPSEHGGKQLITAGLDEDRYPMIAGKRVTSADGDIGLKSTRFHIERGKTKLAKETSQRVYKNGKRKFLRYKNYIGKGKYENLPYINAEQIADLADGRIPDVVAGDFIRFGFRY